MSSPIVLGYWDIRGYAQPIRLLLAYNNANWVDKHYTIGPAPDWNREEWLKDKFALDLDFPNLPYLIDGDVRISQSNAILRYIARKHDQLGRTEEEKIRVDLVENEIMDFRRAFVMMCYNADFEKMKGPYLENLPGKLKLLSEFLGKRNFFAGDSVTFPDFIIYEILDHHKLFSADCLNNFQNIQDFMSRIEGLKGVAEFLKSSRNIKFPLNGPMA